MTVPPTHGHPVYLVPGEPGGNEEDGAVHANLPADLRWAGEGSDPAADAVELLRAMGGDAGALDALTGFAGLERLLVWVAARDIAASTPAGVRIGATAERQTSWLRRVQGPGQLSDILDLITPRVERHRSMPGVFGLSLIHI